MIGLTLAKKKKAYLISELAKKGQSHFIAAFTGQALAFDYAPASECVMIYHAQYRLPITILFWFAWYAFHPDTDIFRAE